MTAPQSKITIIGLGLIGGSLGLALKSGGLQGVELVGHDIERSVEKRAEKIGAIDRGEHNLPRAVEGASVVIVAVPLVVMREVLQQIAPHLSEGAVVTDTSSTKALVMDWAAESLPDHVSFVGGHPMAGKETSGIEHAEAGLFRGRPYCVSPEINATPSAISRVTGIISLTGADAIFIDPAEHDQYAAAVSHLPLLLSTALFQLLRSSPSWDDMATMAGPGFRDMTRLASGDPGMAHAIWRTNREGLIHWLERMIAQLTNYRDMLKDAQDDTLLQTFLEAQMQREQFTNQPPQRRRGDPGPQVDRGKALLDLLVGSRLADNLRRAQTINEAPAEAPGRSARAPLGKRATFADRVAEGVRRDLEKLERNLAADEGDSTPDKPENTA